MKWPYQAIEFLYCTSLKQTGFRALDSVLNYLEIEFMDSMENGKNDKNYQIQ